MRRKDALRAIRFAGYHGERAPLVRLFVEARIAWDRARAEWEAGARARAEGLPCGCPACTSPGAERVEWRLRVDRTGAPTLVERVTFRSGRVLMWRTDEEP